ncbi:MAG TPA: hypothetical protein VF425_04065 [Thermoanaerobaculia bacterium]
MTPNRRSTVQEPPRHRTASSPAWSAFESKLAEALAVLEEDQYLVISAKRGWAYVQFAGQGSFGVRAECVSNNYLDEAHALRAGQMTALRRIGWSAPTGTPTEASPKRQPEGSPNFFREFDRPVPYEAVARMAVRSLTGVFEIPHPGYLHYKAFDKNKRTILVPTLGLKREEPAPPPEKPPEDTVDGIRKLVLKAIREASGNQRLQCAADGELALRFGSAAVYVRVLEAPPFVRMFSPVLEDVEVDDRLLGRLNELNRDTRFARFLVVEERVVVSVDVPATPFVAEHVAEACLQVGSLADEIGGTLQKKFGGRRAFEEAPKGPEVQ